MEDLIASIVKINRHIAVSEKFYWQAKEKEFGYFVRQTKENVQRND